MTAQCNGEKLLQRTFFARSPQFVARSLLGKVLVHRIGKISLRGRIVETEAYLGLDDPASHAYSGKSSANEVLFGAPGHAHVYLIYGLHHCLNVSAHRKGHAGGVLLRAVWPMQGIELMAKLRGKPGTTDPYWLTGGPGRICQAFGIDRSTHNGQDITLPSSAIQILDDGYQCRAISITQRIGITKATEEPLRFVLQKTRNS